MPLKEYLNRQGTPVKKSPVNEDLVSENTMGQTGFGKKEDVVDMEHAPGDFDFTASLETALTRSPNGITAKEMEQLNNQIASFAGSMVASDQPLQPEAFGMLARLASKGYSAAQAGLDAIKEKMVTADRKGKVVGRPGQDRPTDRPTDRPAIDRPQKEGEAVKKQQESSKVQVSALKKRLAGRQ